MAAILDHRINLIAPVEWSRKSILISLTFLKKLKLVLLLVKHFIKIWPYMLAI